LSTKSSTWIAKHLREEHHIAKKPFQASICPTIIDSEEEATILDLMRNPKRPVNMTNFQRNLTKWIVVGRQAFLAMEEPSFREMISGLSLDAAEMLPKSSNTTRNWTRDRSYLGYHFNFIILGYTDVI